MKSAGGLVAPLITDKKVKVKVDVVLRLCSATEVEVESIVGTQSRPSF